METYKQEKVCKENLQSMKDEINSYLQESIDNNLFDFDKYKRILDLIDIIKIYEETL